MNSNSIEIALTNLKTAEDEIVRLIREERTNTATKKDLQEARNKLLSVGTYLYPFYAMYEVKRLDLLRR